MKLQFGIKFLQVIDHQKDVTKKATKANPVIVKDELTSTTKTKTKPVVDKDELTAKVSVIYLFAFWKRTNQMYLCCFWH